MSARPKRIPSLLHHKASGQARVRLNGRDFYCGPWGSAKANQEYARIIGEWLASGFVRTAQTVSVTVHELALAYLRHAERYYLTNGEPTTTILRVKVAIRALIASYGSTPAASFGPLALQAIQSQLVREGQSRRYLNYLIAEIKRMFRWAVSQEMAPASVFEALRSVSGLKVGRSEARESAPVLPVPLDVVAATMPHLPPVVADMVRLEVLLGCRPGELCQLRPCDIDRTGDVWAFRPARHKTMHRGRSRVIFIGPRGQAILAPYLLRSADEFCFQPAESERKRLDARSEARKTPISYGNRPGSNRVKKAKRAPGDRFTTGAYSNAVRRACDIADRKAHEADPSIDEETRIVPRWTPNQLRHTRATEVRREFGLEAAQVVLGHAKADVTQIYAERDEAKAAEIMRRIG